MWLWKALVWTSVAALGGSLVGCSTIAGQPVPAPIAAADLPQPELEPGQIAERDPASVLTAGLYNMLRQPLDDFVVITGYRHQVATSDSTSEVSAYAFMPRSGSWERIPDEHVVWSRDDSEWVLAERNEDFSPGPVGDRGVPTLKVEAVYGTSYYTFSYEELGDKPLEYGLERGFGLGRPLPPSAVAGKYSPGARGYVATQTVIDPIYRLYRVKNANTLVDEPQLVYTCPQPSPECATLASSLEEVDETGGQFTNFAETVRLELDGSGGAELAPIDPGKVLATLTYTFVDTVGPPRIVFQAKSTDDAKAFEQEIGIAVDQFAFFGYEGQVVVGAAQPAHTSEAFVGYNRIAANDLVAQWTPALPRVID